MTRLVAWSSVPLFAAAFAFAVIGTLVRIDPCGRNEELQPFAIASALCAGAGIALLPPRHRWGWAIAMAVLVYVALWLRWAVQVDHCLN